MFFSVGVAPTGTRDRDRIRGARTAQEADLVFEAFEVACRLLRFDPHLQGQGTPDSPYRVIVVGPIRVIYTVRPIEDRYAEEVTTVPNLDWVP